MAEEEEEQEEDENKRIRPRERALGQKKRVWYYEKWVGRHASFAPRRSVKYTKLQVKTIYTSIFNMR